MKLNKAIKYFVAGFLITYLITYLDNDYSTLSSTPLIIKSLLSGFFASIFYFIFHKKLDGFNKNVKDWKVASKEEKVSYNKKFEVRSNTNLKKTQYIGIASLFSGAIGLALIFIVPDTFSWIAGLFLVIFFAGSLISYSFVKEYFGNNIDEK